MSSRVETFINPLQGVGQAPTPFMQAALALGRFCQKELELDGTGLEKLEIEISATKIPTITLTSLGFVDGEWKKKAVRLIRQDREENVELLHLCDVVLTTAVKVDDLINGPIQPATAILQRETPSIIDQILALKGKLKEQERINAKLQEELREGAAATQEALALAEKARKQLVESHAKTMAGLQNNLEIIRENFDALNLVDRRITLKSEDESAAILNLVCLQVQEDGIDIATCNDLAVRMSTEASHLKMIRIEPVKLGKFLKRRYDEDCTRDKISHENFKKSVDLTDYRDINRVLQRALTDHDVFIHDMIHISQGGGIINPKGKYPCLVLHLFALESRLTDIKKLYKDLKSEEKDQDAVGNHIKDIEGRLETLKGIRQSFLKYLQRCRGT